MKTINEYLNDIAGQTETGSDYAIAGMLGVSRTHISNYRNGRTPDDNICLLIAEKLGIEPWEVIAAANAERQIRLANKDQAKKWESLWRRVRRGGTTAIIALAIVGFYDLNSTAYAKILSDDVSIIRSSRSAVAHRRWMVHTKHAAGSSVAGFVKTLGPVSV